MVDIYNLAKASIEIGGYKLAKKLNELTAIMIVGQIDPAEYEQLTELARKHANPETEPGEANILGALRTLNAEVEAVKARLAKLEEAGGEEPAEEEIVEWERWDGLPTSGYKFGKKVRHLGKVYISEYVGLNTWEPGLLGTEQVWRLISEEDTEA